MQLLRQECENQLKATDSADFSAKYEIMVRATYDKRINGIERQRLQMEEAMAIRLQELDAELAERRYQCEIEIKHTVEMKRRRIETVLKSLEKLGCFMGFHSTRTSRNPKLNCRSRRDCSGCRR